MPNLSPIQAPAEAVKEVAGLFHELTTLLREWISGADVRKMKLAIEAAEQYIFINENTSLDPKKRVELLKRQKDVFFKYN